MQIHAVFKTASSLMSLHASSKSAV